MTEPTFCWWSGKWWNEGKRGGKREREITIKKRKSMVPSSFFLELESYK